MKKFILSAIAVGALGIGGIAQADIIDGVGNTISRIFGVPYDPGPTAVPNSVYTDAYGRHYQVDAYGRQVPLGQYGSYRDQWGRTVYMGANNQPMYVEQNGQVFPYGAAPGAYAQGPVFDDDRDGVPNQYDRYPRDGRYR